MKIIFSGGGTLGPVVPLLAVAEAVKQKYPATKFIWVGTKTGPERAIVESAGLPFFVVGAGKWRRYFSFWNFVDVFKITISFFQSLYLIWREKPDILISAGGFVSVPLHWAGYLLGVPAWVHQQDVELGLANRLMFKTAKKITMALRDTASLLPEFKTEWIGNPVRDLSVGDTVETRLIASLQARKKFNIPENAPVIFALGGGTGSASINKLVLDALSQWPPEWHIIHLVGKERPRELTESAAKVFSNYHVYQFFNKEMKSVYAIADVVIARAGFGTLTELAALSKAAVILPMYGTHQEANARLFAEHDGIVLIPKGTDTGHKLAQVVRELVEKPQKRAILGARFHELLPRAKPEKIVQIVEELVEN